MLLKDARIVSFLVIGLFAIGTEGREPFCTEQAASQTSVEEKTKDLPATEAKKDADKDVKGLVALAELVEKPTEGILEVKLSVKNVSDKPITICQCPFLHSQIKVQWIGPDGKKLSSKHYEYPPSNFILTKDYFVVVPAGETRRIVPTIRFHTAAAKLAPPTAEERRKMDAWEAADSVGRAERSNLAASGEHRVIVSFTNESVSYPGGRGGRGDVGGPSTERIVVDNVWTGTVAAKEVTFKVK